MADFPHRPELPARLPWGLPVWVLPSPNGRRKDVSFYSQAREARIVKVAPVWVTLAAAGDPQVTWRMRRDTQNEGAQLSGNNQRFVTEEQLTWEQRRDEAIRHLDEQRIRIGIGSPWQGREAELFDLIRGAL